MFRLWEEATMEELIKQLCDKVGIDRGLAEKITGLLQKNPGEVAKLLEDDEQGVAQHLQSAGISETIAQKVAAFLKENAAKLPQWLGTDAKGIIDKAKELVGSMLGGRKESE
jgi:hypothetical protein